MNLRSTKLKQINNIYNSYLKRYLFLVDELFANSTKKNTPFNNVLSFLKTKGSDISFFPTIIDEKFKKKRIAAYKYVLNDIDFLTDYLIENKHSFLEKSINKKAMKKTLKDLISFRHVEYYLLFAFYNSFGTNE